MVRADDEPALVAEVRAHAAAAHDMDLTAELVRALARRRGAGSQGEPPPR